MELRRDQARPTSSTARRRSRSSSRASSTTGPRTSPASGRPAYDFAAVEEGLGQEGGDPGQARRADAGVRLQPAPQAVPGSARAPGLRARLQLRGSQQEAVLRSLRARRELLRQFRARRDRAAAGPRARDPERGARRGAAGGLHHRVEEPRQRTPEASASTCAKRPSCSPKRAGSCRS